MLCRLFFLCVKKKKIQWQAVKEANQVNIMRGGDDRETNGK